MQQDSFLNHWPLIRWFLSWKGTGGQWPTTYTNLSRFCFLGTIPVLVPNVWANEKCWSWDSLPGIKLGTSRLLGWGSTSWPQKMSGVHVTVYLMAFHISSVSIVINISSSGLLVACWWSVGDIGGRQFVSWLFCQIFTCGEF